MQVAVSLLVAACLAGSAVGHRNSLSIGPSNNLSAVRAASSNQSVLKVASSNQSASKFMSSINPLWNVRSNSQTNTGSNQSASKIASSNQSALKVASSTGNQSTLKVAPKSPEELQEEVHKLKQENVRLRGLLGNTTQKTSTTDALAAKSNDASPVKPSATPVKSPATPVKPTAATVKLNQTASQKDVKQATPASVQAVNHALDAAVRKPSKDNLKKNVTVAHETTRAKLRAAIKALDHDEADIAKIEKESENEKKEPIPVAHVESTDSARDAALEDKADKMIHFLKDEAKGASKSTRMQKITRQLVAPPAETMKPIIQTFKKTIAKLEKLNKHDGDENRMVFCEEIAKDLESCQAPFKDHEGVTYKEHSASKCLGLRGPMDADLKTDSAEECQTKCNDLGPECAGFLHMTSGADAGMCHFKKGGIKDIETSDKSACFEKEDPRDPLVKKFISLNLWVLEQASIEIDWICQSGFRSTREENRVDSFRMVVQTYIDGIQCQPGDIPCPGGTISGEKPMCECKEKAASSPAPAAAQVAKCEMWDFVGLPNSDLMAIKMGPTTGTKMTEVHTLGKSSNYKNWVLQTGTGMELTDGSQSGSEWDFVALPNSDLMGILMGPKTGSKKTEVHILSKSSNYAKFALHAATGLELTTQKQWDFAAAPNGDLMCIKKGPTGSGKTEVHILSKSSNYAKFNLHTATGLELTDGATEWDFAAMPNGDLMCIKMGPTTGSGKTEVHILSKSSNYAKFNLHTATGLELTTHKEWSFATLPNGDLMCIKKGPTTGTKKTEVHILSKSSNYKNWVLQTGTGLALTVGAPGTCS